MFPHGFSALFPLGVSHGNSSPLRRTRRGLQAETQRLFRWTDLGRWSMYAGSIGGRPHVVFRHWNDGNIWELDSGNHQGPYGLTVMLCYFQVIELLLVGGLEYLLFSTIWDNPSH